MYKMLWSRKIITMQVYIRNNEKKCNDDIMHYYDITHNIYDPDVSLK